jgi:dTMP kinase
MRRMPELKFRPTTMLIVFEGLDQSGKQTQAERLAERLRADGRQVEMLSFPNYETPIGREIGAVLHGHRDLTADVMQLLYVANRYEAKGRIQDWLARGVDIICDRYLASSIAYGEAQGLDPAWLAEVQRYLPQPDLTILLDIAPETAVKRKERDRDRYERDLELLGRVRQSYRRQATAPGWVLVPGERAPDEIAAEVFRLVQSAAAR